MHLPDMLHIVIQHITSLVKYDNYGNLHRPTSRSILA